MSRCDNSRLLHREWAVEAIHDYSTGSEPVIEFTDTKAPSAQARPAGLDLPSPLDSIAKSRDAVDGQATIALKLEVRTSRAPPVTAKPSPVAGPFFIYYQVVLVCTRYRCFAALPPCDRTDVLPRGRLVRCLTCSAYWPTSLALLATRWQSEGVLRTRR